MSVQPTPGDSLLARFGTIATTKIGTGKAFDKAMADRRHVTKAFPFTEVLVSLGLSPGDCLPVVARALQIQMCNMEFGIGLAGGMDHLFD